MNKIYIDQEEYELVISESSFYSINISKNTNLTILVLDNLDISINILMENVNANIYLELKENSNVSINQLGINTGCNITVNLKENSILTYYDSILSSVDSINKILINLAKNTICNFSTNGVNLSKGKLYFEIDGNIFKESSNVTLSENSKIINLTNGDSKIIPNLIVDNKEVSASHSAFIGTFSIDDINYLKSRGLNDEQARKLLLKAVLLSGMDFKFEKEIFTNVIINNNY